MNTCRVILGELLMNMGIHAAPLSLEAVLILCGVFPIESQDRLKCIVVLLRYVSQEVFSHSTDFIPVAQNSSLALVNSNL